MKKVKAHIKLFKPPGTDHWVMTIIDPAAIRQALVDKFVKSSDILQIHLDATIERPREDKTISQLGYMHAAVWPVFYRFYEDQGIQVDTKEEKERIRDDIKVAIGFVQERTEMITGDKYYKVRSFANATKDQTSDMIDRIIRLAADYGMIVPDPLDYLQQHGRTEFD